MQVAKYFSDEKGLKNIDISLIKDKTLLIIHSGGDSQRCPSLSVCGKAWSFFPCLTKSNSLVCNVDIVIDIFRKLVKVNTNGVFVFCGDTLMSFDVDYDYKWRNDGITGLSLPVMKKKGPEHGVYNVNEKTGELLGYYQKPSIKVLEDIGAVSMKKYNNIIQECVLLDSGVVYIPPNTCEILLKIFVYVLFLVGKTIM